MNLTKIRPLIFFIFSVITTSAAFAQNRNYMEANGGFMHYNSPQNNLTWNPSFGLSVYQRATRNFGLEAYCNAAFIDEDVKYSYNGITSTKREKFLTGWMGFRADFGVHTETQLIMSFVGFAFRLDRNTVGPEIGMKYGHQLFQSHFWLHASTYIQADKYAFYDFNEPSAEDGPLQAGFFAHVKLGIACHFN
jgi:hypothetical protein